MVNAGFKNKLHAFCFYSFISSPRCVTSLSFRATATVMHAEEALANPAPAPISRWLFETRIALHTLTYLFGRLTN